MSTTDRGPLADTDKGQIVTIQHHIVSEQRKRFPQATGAFSWLLAAITLATKMTQAKVARAGLLDVLGAFGSSNIQGEEQQKLDVYANNALIHCLGVRENVAIIASEENEEPITFDGRSGPGKYIVLFDPLDGSSNIDVNVSVGTIFSIFALPDDYRDADANVAALQKGSQQLAAGYVIYGSSTIMVYSTGHGVHGFTLDPSIGEFLLSHPDMHIPEHGRYLSVNDSYERHWTEPVRALMRRYRGLDGKREAMNVRYVGSLVADFHRNLLYGGI